MSSDSARPTAIRGGSGGRDGGPIGSERAWVALADEGAPVEWVGTFDAERHLGGARRHGSRVNREDPLIEVHH